MATVKPGGSKQARAGNTSNDLAKSASEFQAMRDRWEALSKYKTPGGVDPEWFHGFSPTKVKLSTGAQPSTRNRYAATRRRTSAHLHTSAKEVSMRYKEKKRKNKSSLNFEEHSSNNPSIMEQKYFAGKVTFPTKEGNNDDSEGAPIDDLPQTEGEDEIVSVLDLVDDHNEQREEVLTEYGVVGEDRSNKNQASPQSKQCEEDSINISPDSIEIDVEVSG
mmetsp:Transcript_16328/g.47009  ORF Transcript_16328/g.47009 Transcript_16328/m.47009 type:complete len:220 (-) Transcript_16328:151-810(-)